MNPFIAAEIIEGNNTPKCEACVFWTDTKAGYKEACFVEPKIFDRLGDDPACVHFLPLKPTDMQKSQLVMLATAGMPMDPNA